MARTEEEEEEPQHDQDFGQDEYLLEEEHKQPEGGVIARQGTTHPYFTLLLHALCCLKFKF
jgi:hypothetical protein